MNTPDFIYDPPRWPLSIIHLDDDILVLSKPSGLLSVPGKPAEHADCLESRAMHTFPDARTIHRLDHPTSGIVIMAMNPRAQKLIGQQFERRDVKKTYIARIWGHCTEDNGEIDLPLRCDWPNRPRQMVCHEHGRAAQTHWKVISREQNPQVTRVELSPKTGRSHQLRVHMLEIGHPILGDVFYGPEESRAAANRLQLHAYKVTFRHPKTNEWVNFCDPCPF